MTVACLPGSPPPVTRSSSLDTAGAGLALACAIHCAAAPLLLVAASAAGLGWLVSEPFGRAVVMVSLTLASWSLVTGRRRHGQAGPLALLGAALPCFLAAELAGWSRVPAAVAATGGGLLVAAAHLWNRRLVRLATPAHAGE